MIEKSFLKGAYDLHIHAGPSVANRLVDAGDMMKSAMEVGYKGFLVKDHYMPSADACLMVEKFVGDGSCKAFSSIAMNNSVGGFNIMALDAAYNMGTRMVYMPTVSSRLHIDGHKGKKFTGSGNMNTIELEKPMYILDANGKVIPECVEVLKYAADKKDLTVSSGHMTWQETDAMIEKAFALGVKNIVVNHASYQVNAPVDVIARWAKNGVWIEVTCCEFGQVIWDDDTRFNSIYLLRDYMDHDVPFDHVFISSDFGQSISPHPIDGMLKFLNLLNDWVKIDEDTLAMMIKTNPAKIMNQDAE